jgi:hypothetical protein
MKALSHLKLLLIACFIVSTLASTGCGRMGVLAARAVITTAAVAMVLAAHDAHHHHRRCGHRHIIVDKRKIYDYQGRWEYYDRKSDTWYYYEDPPH